MNKKILLSVLFVLSLLPMNFIQFGGAKGVQEVSGMINLETPIGIIGLVVFFIGVWIRSKDKLLQRTLCYTGMLCIVASEIWNFFTWNQSQPLAENIKDCFAQAFPMFYIGLASSILMIILYAIIDKKMSD